jgi:hypothetical protein
MLTYFFQRSLKAMLMVLAMSLLAACGGGDGATAVVAPVVPPGTSGVVLTRSSAEPAGANCANGGTKIEAGIDTSGNAALEPGEVTATSYVCSGPTPTPTAAVLTSISVEQIGLNCGFGGTQIAAGLDTNGNAVLDTSEITTTSYICNTSTAKSWSSPQRLEDRIGASSISPGVAYDNRGNVLVVWSRANAASSVVLSSRYNPTVGWSSPTVVATYNNNVPIRLKDFQLVIDSGGNTLAVWTEDDGVSLVQMVSSRLPVGSNIWTAPEVISAAANIEPQFLQMAMDPFGNVTAMWNAFNSVDNDVWARRYTPAAGWGAAQVIQASANGPSYYPQLVADSQGNVLAAWNQDTDSTGQNGQVWQRRYSISTDSWGVSSPIDGQNTGFTSQIKMGQDASGNVLATWLRDDAGVQTLWGNAYTASTGLWGTAQKFRSLAAGGIQTQNLAVDRQGNGMVVWNQYTSTPGLFSNIWSARFNASTGWGTSTLVELNDNGPAGDAVVVVDAVGNVTALWTQAATTDRKSPYDRWSNSYSPATGWAQPTKVTSRGEAVGFDSRLVIDPSTGTVLAVWIEALLLVGTDLDLWAAVLR